MAKTRTKRNDVAETALWQQVFSDKDAEPGQPRLRWPGDPNDRNVSTMNSGLRFFAPGVQLTIWNSATHHMGELSEQAALERLSTLSLLARWIETRCSLERPPKKTPIVVMSEFPVVLDRNGSARQDGDAQSVADATA
ncbi:TIGR02391 family protein [Nocardia sp. NBC_00881]|uniref:TIGR02391 family protein n=1 Tax=Nocardia sp. NBC_00881 TaxID=2975995 RepID=UPI00386603DB